MSELYFPSLSAENNHGDGAAGDGPSSTAELQGALCGLLCMDSQANRMAWYKTLYPELAPDDKEALDLTALFDDTVQSLNSLDFDLQLAIPEDHAPLASRILALADWCQGLIFGLGASGLKEDTELSADCQEYIADTIKISQISDDVSDNINEEETNFEELVEYLRMGLFLLYSELQPVEASDDTPAH